MTVSPTLLVVSFFFIVGLIVITVYNSMVKKDKLTSEAWHGIDVQLKRRYDLIPNLVEVVKGYAKHESSTLANVVSLRNAMGKGSIAAQGQGQTELSELLKTIFALSENYPDLKANQNFMELHSALQGIEDSLQNARRYYNATVRDFNTFITIFPNNILAGIFKFSEKDFFGVENEVERANIKVQL